MNKLRRSEVPSWPGNWKYRVASRRLLEAIIYPGARAHLRRGNISCIAQWLLECRP